MEKSRKKKLKLILSHYKDCLSQYIKYNSYYENYLLRYIEYNDFINQSGKRIFLGDIPPFVQFTEDSTITITYSIDMDIDDNELTHTNSASSRIIKPTAPLWITDDWVMDNLD